MSVNRQINSQRDQLVKTLLSSGQTLGLAESCTGGLLSSILTEVPGVSEFFKGSVISYAGSVKVNILGVPRPLIQALGEVSEPVARSMAKGARQVLESDWALSVTGIAGPSGGSEEKPVGTVCFGLEGPGESWQSTQIFKNSGRADIQRQSALFALTLLNQFLSGGG